MAENVLTPERIGELASLAYKLAGYEVLRMGDGTHAVSKCGPKTIDLMNKFQALLVNEISGEAPPA